MLPVLVSMGPLKIYSMGITLLAGLFFGLYYWWKLGRDEHWDEIALFDSFFLALLSFFAVGRLGYVLSHWEDLGTVYRFIAFLTYPGISYAAGIMGSIITVFLFARTQEWDVWKIFDIAAVTLTLITFFGFIGGLLNGSNPGIITDWGLAYPGVEGKRFPVDIWGILWSAIAFGMSIRIRKNFRFYSWYKGSASVAKDGLAALAATASAGFYFLVAGFLDDGRRFGIFPLVSIAGLLIAVTAVVLIYTRSGQGTKWRR